MGFQITDSCLYILQRHGIRALIGSTILHTCHYKTTGCQSAQIKIMCGFIHHQPCASTDPEDAGIDFSIFCFWIDYIQFQIPPAMSEPGVHLCVSNIIYCNILRLLCWKLQCLFFCFCHNLSASFLLIILSLKYFSFILSQYCFFCFYFPEKKHSFSAKQGFDLFVHKSLLFVSKIVYQQ